jgi:hypothetical protein
MPDSSKDHNNVMALGHEKMRNHGSQTSEVLPSSIATVHPLSYVVSFKTVEMEEAVRLNSFAS